MQQIKKGTAVFLSVFMAITVMPLSVFAAEENTPKEEVVYINLNASGTVEEINVVNILGGTAEGAMTDYGEYLDVRNMTTTDLVDYSGGAVKINSSAEKLYYEGKLESTMMPWDIQIRYYLDGKEYAAEDIAGKSGELKITIHIAQNQKCRGGFYDNYALQASLSLDTDQCKNIAAPDAAIANVGSNKQLTYTILPGKGADIEITAEVSEFEMDGISINGIPLNLNIEVDDEELMEQVTELLTAIGQLDDGAAKLQEGAAQLQDGAQSGLKSGVNDLQDGAEQLHGGAADLKDGGTSLKDGAANLQDGADVLDEGVRSLSNGVGQIQEALNTLNQQSPELVNGSASFQAALLQLQEALSGAALTTEDLSALTDASSAMKSGIDDLVNGTASLKQTVSFEAYQSAMGQNGLDMNSLRQNNTAAISSLGQMIQELSGQASVLNAAGADTSAIDGQIAQLQSIATLLGANNAGIDGTEAYLTAVNQSLSDLLQGATALQMNYTAFDTKIGELVNKLGGMAYQMSELSAAVNTLVSEYEKLDQGISRYTGAVAQIVAGYTQISDGTAQLVTGSHALKTGSASLYDGTGELLSGIAEMYHATGTLYDGTGALDEGVQELLTGIVQLYGGAGELKDGTSTMREETRGMDTEITDKIDELINTVTGGDFEITSFVSEKNTNVQSVQFVIQTDGVQVEEAAEAIDEAPKELTVWQKFLNLFGLYHE